MTRFVVTDESGEISWDSDKEAAQTFRTFDAAEKRARELARSAPGETISIYRLAGECKCAVLGPVTTKEAK